jgi:hypothetical protein
MDDESSRVVVVGNVGAAGLTKAKVVVFCAFFNGRGGRGPLLSRSFVLHSSATVFDTVR